MTRILLISCRSWSPSGASGQRQDGQDDQDCPLPAPKWCKWFLASLRTHLAHPKKPKMGKFAAQNLVNFRPSSLVCLSSLLLVTSIHSFRYSERLLSPSQGEAVVLASQTPGPGQYGDVDYRKKDGA